MAKATFRIPDAVLEGLRARSREEKRSLNAVTIDALLRGLGTEAPQPSILEILGDLVLRAPTGTYSPEESERLVAGLSDEERHLDEALEWTRRDFWES